MSGHVEHVKGRAIDSEGTKFPHQIGSIEYNESKQLYELNFSVYSPDKKYNPQELVERYFYYETDNKTGYKMLVINPIFYGDFISAIRPEENESFKKNVSHAALTYTILFAPEKGFQDFSYRPTIATMTDSYTIQEAENKLKSSCDEEFSIWNQFCLDYKKINPDKQNKKKIDFVRTLTTTTDIVRNQARIAAFKDNVDCVFSLRNPKDSFDVNNYTQRLDYDEIKKIKAEYFFYGSVLQQKEVDAEHQALEHAFVSGTAARKGIDAFNISVMRSFALNNENIFPGGVAGALAQYKINLFKQRVKTYLGWAA